MMCSYLVSVTIFFSALLPGGGHLKVKWYSFADQAKAIKFAKYYVGKVEHGENLHVASVEITAIKEKFACDNYTRGEE